MPREPLSQEVVVSMAMEITRTAGLSALTMRELAARLEVTPMALYRYVPNRDALVKLVADGVGALIHPAIDEDGRWEEGARAWSLEQHRVLREHAGVAAWLVQNGPAGDEAYRLLDVLASCLIRGGFSTTDTSRGCAAIMSWTFTRTLIEDAAAMRTAEGRPERSHDFVTNLEKIAPDERPGAARIGATFFTLSMADIFDAGLEAILAGIEAGRVDGQC